MSSTPPNKILALIDCDSFYCSCERLFNLKARKKPVVVLSNNDGCVVSRTKEVKELGISMGVPYFKIKDICQKMALSLLVQTTPSTQILVRA
jgi:DNA polymerase V